MHIQSIALHLLRFNHLLKLGHPRIKVTAGPEDLGLDITDFGIILCANGTEVLYALR